MGRVACKKKIKAIDPFSKQNLKGIHKVDKNHDDAPGQKRNNSEKHQGRIIIRLILLDRFDINKIPEKYKQLFIKQPKVLFYSCNNIFICN